MRQNLIHFNHRTTEAVKAAMLHCLGQTPADRAVHCPASECKAFGREVAFNEVSRCCGAARRTGHSLPHETGAGTYQAHLRARRQSRPRTIGDGFPNCAMVSNLGKPFSENTDRVSGAELRSRWGADPAQIGRSVRRTLRDDNHSGATNHHSNCNRSPCEKSLK